MKIVFVETPSPWLVNRSGNISLGLLYLATVLKEEGYDVRLARPRTIEGFGNFHDANIICMGGTTLEYPMNVECAKWIRAHFPGIKVFIGGPHATALPHEVVESGLFDAVGVGEGEHLIVNMVKDVEQGKLKKIYLNKGFITDLDTLPFPDRVLVEGDYGKNLFAHGKCHLGEKSENIITSRGCSNNCAFCASRCMWYGKIRYRSVENVVAEINQITETTGIKQFGMWDDTLTLNKKRCLKLYEMLRGMDIAWRCLARADSLDPELCMALSAAGCKEVCLGIESGDQRVLDFLNKNTDKEAMLEGCMNANEAGLNIRGLFMIGTPGEQEDTPELTIEYIDKLNLDVISLSTFTPLPGSPIWDNPDKYNCEILSKDFTKYNEYSFVMKDGKKVHNEYEPLIHNRFLTINQMIDNVERMRIYIEETGKYNKG